MNIFVAGIHGVGKSHFCSKTSLNDFVHVSASVLIKEERGLATWSADKRVGDIDSNQRALAAAVNRRNSLGKRLLLDGHFVLLDSFKKLSPLGAEIFSPLNISSVILLEAPAETILERIETRDQRKLSLEEIRDFTIAERHQAQRVCTALRIPLKLLVSPSVEEFFSATNGAGAS